MEVNETEGSRPKRKTRGEDDEKWECSACTYINSRESYKCEMCFMRKGTSTRKPRLNPQVVEQQQLIAQAILKEKDDDHRKKKDHRSSDKNAFSGNNIRLKHFDRSSPLLFEIFANGYSVVITEFQLKSKMKLAHFPESPSPSNCSPMQGFAGAAHSDQLSPVDSNLILDTTHRQHNPQNSPEDDFSESLEPKPLNLSGRQSGGPGRPGVSGAVYEKPSTACSYSSASSSVGGNNLSRQNSPHRSVGPCFAEIKREQAALEAEQAARDGDDEGDEEEDQSPTTVGWRTVARSHQSPHCKSSRSNRLRSSNSISNEPVTKVAVVLKEPTSEVKLEKLAEDNAPLSTSRPRRQHPQIDGPNPYVSTRRRKTNSTRLRSKMTVPSRRRTRPTSASDLAEQPWSPPEMEQSLKRRRLRITMSGLKSVTDSKKPEDISLGKCSLLPRKRRVGSQRPQLKCKIRVLHPDLTNPVEDANLETVDQPHSFSTSAKSDESGSRSILDISSKMDKQMSPTLPVSGVNHIPTRLSTESQNTSAMIDSSGATALEISQ
ncbi:unnamed protein product [Calicophoron daubneyi]|uniref:RanBP2-type domain-containing protein n=1 Tax=Calicophoron daubneyi TaxID=300641 RepID=A0AAV2TW75_CALDB